MFTHDNIELNEFDSGRDFLFLGSANFETRNLDFFYHELNELYPKLFEYLG